MGSYPPKGSLCRNSQRALFRPTDPAVTQEVFGCKPFAGKTPSWSEVANRLIYIAPLVSRNKAKSGMGVVGGNPAGGGGGFIVMKGRL